MQSAALGQSIAVESQPASDVPRDGDVDADGDGDGDADVDSVALRDWAAWRPNGEVALVNDQNAAAVAAVAVHEHLCDCSFAEAGLTSAAERKCEFLATFTLVPPWSASQNTHENSSTALKCAKRRLLVQHSRRPVRATRLNCAKQQQQQLALSEQRTRKLPATGELLDSDDDEQDKIRPAKNGGARHSGAAASTHNASGSDSSRWVFKLQRTQASAKPASGSNKFMLVYSDESKRMQVQTAPKSAGSRKGLPSRTSWATSGAAGAGASAKASAFEKVVPASDLKNEDELDESSVDVDVDDDVDVDVDVDIDIPTGLVINSLPDVNVKPLTLTSHTKAEPHFSVQKAPPTQFFVPSTAKRVAPGPVTTCAVQPRTFRVPSKAAELLLTTPRSAASSSAALRSRIKQPVVSNSNAHMGPVSLMKLLPNSTVN